MAGTGELLPRCGFPPPATPVTCAVSGGADSLALLVLAAAAGCEVTAVHVDHGLREGSADEAGIVAATADRFGARFRAERVHVAPGPNLEARARAARSSVLPAGALTGHTADDQAETVILALLRGAGLDGLAGIDPARRPILGLRRTETAVLCGSLGLDPVRDPSNLDPRFRRNRVRHEVLPVLCDVAGRDVVPVIARQCALLRADAELLDGLAADLDVTDAAEVTSAPVAVARRAVRTWLREPPPDGAAVERVLGVARGEAVATELAGGIGVRRSGGRLHRTG